MRDKLYAFWKYDNPPYLLGGEVESIDEDGFVTVKGYSSFRFRPVKIVSLEKGIKLQKKLHKAEVKYRRIVKDANNELRSVVRCISE